MVVFCAITFVGAAAQVTLPTVATLPKEFKVMAAGVRSMGGTRWCPSPVPREKMSCATSVAPTAASSCAPAARRSVVSIPRIKFDTHISYKDQDFSIISDTDLHINAHLIGKRNPTMSSNLTWIQALVICFADHRIIMGAKKTLEWNNSVNRLKMAFDDEPINIPNVLRAWWESAV
ncbi:hypothetical protein VPH35_063834 [Triticum aestivum]